MTILASSEPIFEKTRTSKGDSKLAQEDHVARALVKEPWLLA